MGANDNIVHLKNGSVIRGRILEQRPGEPLKIETQGGSMFVHTMEEIPCPVSTCWGKAP